MHVFSIVVAFVGGAACRLPRSAFDGVIQAFLVAFISSSQFFDMDAEKSRLHIVCLELARTFMNLRILKYVNTLIITG